MAKPTRCKLTNPQPFPTPGPAWSDVEALWAAGREGAAVDLAAALLPSRISLAELAVARHVWPARLAGIHPAALDGDRRSRWEQVAGLLLRRPTLPGYKESPPIGIVDFPVVGRGGLRDRLVRVQVDKNPGRRDSFPGRRVVSRTALDAMQTALCAVRTILGGAPHFTVRISDLGVAIDEESLGLAVAMAALSAELEWGIPERICLTGHVDATGAVMPVHGFDRKKRLVEEERPLGELLGPQDVPSLERAMSRVFTLNLARGREQFRSLVRTFVLDADRSRLRVTGLDLGWSESLHDVYVDPDLLPHAGDQTWHHRESALAQECERSEQSDAERAEARRRYREWTGCEFDQRRAGAAQRLPWSPIYDAHPASIICGDPGMGKTTLLARIALKVLGESDADSEALRPLPVLVSAADFVSSTDASLTAWVVRTARERWPDASRESLLALATAFGERQVVLLVDGLNEASDNERPLLMQKIKAWMASREAVRCVLMTRRWSLETIEVPSNFRIFHLAGLSASQGDQLVSRTNRLHQADSWQTLQFIRSKPGLALVAANPLLLTLASRLTHSELATLQHWVDVYEHAVPLLLRGPRGAPLQPEELRAHLRGWSLVADRMQQRAVLTLREHDVRDLLAEGLAAKGRAGERRIDAALKVAMDQAGLVVRRGSRDLAFWHPSFQEYLAAVRWSTQIDPHVPAPVQKLAVAWRPLVARREQHEALRLALGRLAFHLGEAQARLASMLLTAVVDNADRDFLVDGAWLRIAADAFLDGVPLPQPVREKLAVRLANRLQRFDDLPAVERLAGLVTRLLSDNQLAADACASLAALLEVPERLSVEALRAAMRLLAAAAPTNEVAREACQRMYEQVSMRKEDGTGFGSGWRGSIAPIAALGLLRVGVVLDGRAVKIFSGANTFAGTSELQEEVVSAIGSNPTAAAAALRPYLEDQDESVRKGALRLLGLACPSGAEAEAWMQWCFDNRAVGGGWVRTLCARAPGARLRLFAIASARGVEAVMQAVGVLLSFDADGQLVTGCFMPWLLEQELSEQIVHQLPSRLQNSRDSPARAFYRALSHSLEVTADTAGDPRAGRAAGWGALLFEPPQEDAARDRWLARLCRFASAAPMEEAGSWLAPLLKVHAIATAAELVRSMILEGDHATLKQAAFIVDRHDLTKWPPAVWDALSGRAEAAASSGNSADVFVCVLPFDERRVPAALQRALRSIMESGTSLAAWEAATWMARLNRMDRELALTMLRTLSRIDKESEIRDHPRLRQWLMHSGHADEEVVRAVVDVVMSTQRDLRPLYVDVLEQMVAQQPERFELLVMELRAPDPIRRERARDRIVGLLFGCRDSNKAAVRDAAERWIKDPLVGTELLQAMADAGVLTEAVREAIRALAKLPGSAGEWAAATQASWGELAPEHWQTVEANLLSPDLEAVLEAANELLAVARRPAALCASLRRCLEGSALQSLRAALLLYGLDQDIDDFIPRLLGCLALPHERYLLESQLVEDRRRRKGIRPSRSRHGLKISDPTTGQVVHEESYPEPEGRERFRPDFLEDTTIAAAAACLLVEMERPEVIPTLLQWLRADAKGRAGRSHLAWSLLQFLNAQTMPEVIDWLLEQVQAGEYSASRWASQILHESNLEPGRHAAVLSAKLQQAEGPSHHWSIIRLLTLCADHSESARVADGRLGALDSRDAWRLARWLIGLGRSTPGAAAAYVDAELALPPGLRFDKLTAFGTNHPEGAALLGKFDQLRLYADPLVIDAWCRRLADGTAEERTKNVETLLGWIRVSGQMPDATCPILAAHHPIGLVVRSSLRMGLQSDDVWTRSIAVEDLESIGVFDDEVEQAARACLCETFGSGPLRSLWGEELVRQEVWEEWIDGSRLRAAQVLLRHGRGTEALSSLRTAVQRVPRGVNGDSIWLDIVKFLLGQGGEELALREPLQRWIAARGPRALFSDQVLPLLAQTGVEANIVRAAVLDRLADDDSFAPHLVRGWATGGPAYTERKFSDPSPDHAWQDLQKHIRRGGTAVDTINGQLKWLAQQNIPEAILRPAMTLLTARYDAARTEQLTRATAGLGSGSSGPDQIELLLAACKEDGAGQRLAKAWLLAALVQ